MQDTEKRQAESETLPPDSELQALRDGYTATHRRFEIFFLILITVTVSALGWKVWTIANTHVISYLPWVVLGGVVVGVFAADIGSGVVHWAADNWGSVDMPVLGEAMIRPFRHHHLAPKDMITHDFIELNGFPSLFAQLPIVFGFCCIGLGLKPALAVFCGVFGIVVAIGTVLTNQFHAWAHMENPPALARFLQRYRIILTPENHDKHHTEPYDRNYCITTGWSNTLVRQLRLFEGIEWCVTKLTGIRPQHELIYEKSLEKRESVQTKTQNSVVG